MKGFKKLLILVLALIAMFSFTMFVTACGGGEEGGGCGCSDNSGDNNDDNGGNNGDQPGGDQPGGDQPGGDQPGGDQPGGDQPGGDQPGGDQPGGDQPGGDQPGGDQPGGDQPGGDQPGGDNPDGNKTFQAIYFDKTEITLVVGEEKRVTVNKGDVSTNFVVEYSSSNENIATVNNVGKITAVGQGTATIYAKWGSYQATLKVNVNHGEYKPSVQVDNLKDNSFIVPEGTEYSFNPYILFNSKKFTNATFTYTTSNANVAISSAKDSLGREVATISGLAQGEVEVTVTASWDGVSGIPSLSKTFKVDVIGYVLLAINGGQTSEVTLYNKQVNTLDGLTRTDADFAITVEGNSTEPEVKIGYFVEKDGVVEFVEDTSIVSYKDGKLIGTGELGSTNALVSVKNSAGEDYSIVIPVTCERAVGDYMNSDGTAYKTVDFNTIDGYLDIADIFGSEIDLVDAYYGREELILENNKIVAGINGVAFGEPEPIVITIFDAEVGYNVEIKPYVFKDAEILTDKYNFSSYDGVVFDGNFVKVSAETFFGEGAKFVQAYYKTADGQETLRVSADGKYIEGITGIKQITDYTLALVSEDNMIIVDVNAYTLIIDEMNDFDYFFVANGTWTYANNKFNIVQGLEFNGHYVLANDIDATEYYKLNPQTGLMEKAAFKALEGTYGYQGWNTTAIYQASFATLGANKWEADGMAKVGLADKGLTGVFDGRGHTISNYTPNNSGLFHFVNGGVVKNVGFSNAKLGYNSGPIASTAVNGATIENVFIEIVEGDTFGRLYAGTAMFSSISNTVLMKNVVVINADPGLATGNYAGHIASNSSTFGTNISDVYVISNMPLMYTKSSTGYTINYEAEFVDGVATDAAKYNIATGVRRYTTLSDFLKDAEASNLDVSSFGDNWTKLEDKVPVYTSSIQASDLKIYVGDVLGTEKGSAIALDADTEISVRYRGVKYDVVDGITIDNGQSQVSVSNSCNLYGVALGAATVTATYEFKGETVSSTFVVNVVPERKTYESEFYYSAGNAEFFEMVDGKLVVVPNALTRIFGGDVTLSTVFNESGEPLQLVGNKVYGVKSSSAGVLETYIDIYTETAGYRVNILSYGLIIDEASDLSFFQLKHPATYNVVAGWQYAFEQGDFLWDGYYVLANNIDASEYGVHDVDNGKVTDANGKKFHLRTYAATRLDYLAGDGTEKNGFRGTFDGQGYTISNLTTTASGLFAIVYGEVKNVAFVNSKVSGNAGGVLAYALAGGAKVNDVYVLTEETEIGGNFSPLAATYGQSVKFNNVIIEDRTTLLSSTKTSAYSFGSLTYDVTNRSGDQNTPITFAAGAFKNVYVISNKALQQTVPANVNGSDVANHVVGFDAEYIDGVLNENVYALTLGTGAKVQEAEVSPVAGIRRYTSGSAFRADENNDFTAFANANWTILNGVPKFASCQDASLSVFFGEEEVKGGHIVLNKGESREVSLRIDGVTVDLENFGGELTIVSQSANVSVNAAIVTANDIAQDFATITISNAKYSFTITVDVVFAVEDYADELYFSAAEGKFFTAEFKEISIDTIFGGEGVEIVKAYDAQNNMLEVGEDNMINGVATNNKSIVETNVTLYSADKALKINIKAVTLIIDELADFEYFTFKNEVYWVGDVVPGYSRWAWNFVDSNEFNWNGYYLLAEDIDATGYVHDIKQGKVFELKADNSKIESNFTTNLQASYIDYLAAGVGLKANSSFIHGFTGTFDGNGHTIANLTTSINGLFGVVAGNALIKDVAFINCATQDNRGGFLAYAVAGNAAVENMYVESNYDSIGTSRYTPVAASWGTMAKITNAVIVDNTTLYSGAIGSDYYYGSLTSNMDRYAGLNAYDNSYAKSGIELSANSIVTKYGENGPYFESVVTAKAHASYTGASIADRGVDFVVEWYTQNWSTVEENYDINEYVEVEKTSDLSITIRVIKQLPDNLMVKAKFADVDTYDNCAMGGYNYQTLGFGSALYNNVIIVSQKALAVQVPKNTNGEDVASHFEFADAKYIDGAENTSNKFVVEGIKRYTSIDALKADAAANAGILESFSSDFWNVEEGVPTFKTTATIVNLSVNGNIVSTKVNALVGDTLDVAWLVNGEAITEGLTLSTDSELVSIDGNSIVVGAQTGVATVTVSKDGVVKTLIINISAPSIKVNGEYLQSGVYTALVGSSVDVSLVGNGADITEGFTLAKKDDSSTLATIEGTKIVLSDSGIGTSEYVLTYKGVELTFKVKSVDPVIMVNGVAVSNSVSIMLGQSFTVELANNDEAITDFTVEKDDTSFVTVDGKTVTASATEVGQSEIKVSYLGRNLVFKVNVEYPEVFADGVACATMTTVIGTEASKTLTLIYNGEPVEGEIVITSDNELVTINGATITAGATAGASELTVSVNGISFTFNVIVTADIEDLAIEPYFSAGDGVFFTEDMKSVLPNEALFGYADAKIVYAEDEEGNPLTVTADGRILGLKTENALTETTIIVYSNIKTVRVNVKAYGLIIDEAEDFAFFHVENFKVYGGGNNYIFADGEGRFASYYVLANDIDATDYVHEFATGELTYSATGAGLAFYGREVNQAAIGDMGLTGTFDGNGYAIKNFKLKNGDCGGIFGIVNGGTVKNVAFIEPVCGGSNTGIITSYAINGAVFSDIYFSTATSGNGGWNTQWFILGAQDSVTIERVVFDWNFKGFLYTGASSGFVTENFANINYNDVYFINYRETNIGTATNMDFVDETATVTKNVRKVLGDAKYVDGVERQATSGKFYDAWNFNTVYDVADYTSIGNYTEPYEVTLLDGIKRYTSIDTFRADKSNNDFSSWNGSLWEIVDGVPMFASQVSSGYQVTVNGVVAPEEVILVNGASSQVNVAVNGIALAELPTLEVVAGSEYVSASGNVITANEISGEATITVKVSYKGVSWNLAVKVIAPVEDYATELQFSIVDGQFFNGDQEVPLSDIIDVATVERVVDSNGNELTIEEDGTLSGLTSTDKDWVDEEIIFYTAEKGIRVTTKVATYIINEVEDLAYFTIKEDWDYGKTVANAYTFAENDFAWKGYYVLAKDIDATGYTHNLDNDKGSGRNTLDAFTGSRMDYLWSFGLRVNGTYKHGFLGTLDGQGHVISNLTTDQNGLLGVIAGGAQVKNIGFDNCNATGGYNVLAYAITGSAYVTNIFVNTSTTFALGTTASAPLIGTWGPTAYKSSNVMIIDNTIVPDNAYSWATGNGSLTASATRDHADQALGFGKDSKNNVGLTNFIIVSNRALSVDVPANVPANQGTVRMDAEYIDGVLNETIYNTSIYGTPATNGPIAGVRRYTSLDALAADSANITEQLQAFVDTGFFTLEGGVPVFKALFDIETDSDYGVKFGTEVLSTVEDNYITRDTSKNIVLTYKGIALSSATPEIEILSGNEYVSIDGTLLTAVAAGLAQIKVSYKNISWTANVKVNLPISEHAEELQFSAYDGLFFNGDQVVDVQSLVGAGVSVDRVTDKDGNVLTYSDGKITGIKTTTTDWEENSIILYTADVALKVNVKIAALIIDEASDFNFFKLQKDADFGKTAANMFTFAEDDFVWDGLYVLVKDVDASEYGKHDVANGKLVASNGNVTNFSRQQAVQMDVYANGLHEGNFKYSHGFTGVFDGQGHTVSNLQTINNGIFGVVAAGTIKNVAFVDCGAATQSLIAERVIGKSVFENVFIDTPAYTSHYNYSAISSDIGSFASFKNVMIIDRSTVTTAPYDWDRNVGALSATYYRRTTSGKEPNATYGTAWGNTPETTSTFDSLFVVATIGLSGSIAPSKTEADYVITMDAQYLDGVEQTGAVPYVQGAKRYTSIAKMQADASANDFTSWNSDIWTIENGVPVFKSAYNLATNEDFSLYFGADALATDVNNLIARDDSKDVFVAYKGITLSNDKFTVEVVNGEEFVSVSGSTVSAINVGVAQIKVTYGEYSVTANVEVQNPAYVVKFGESELKTDAQNVITKGDGVEVSVELNDETVGAPTIEILSGNEFVSVEGAVITANAGGTAQIKISYDGVEWIATINVVLPIEDLGKEYKFSARDGKFFDDELNAITAEDVLGEDATIVSAFDAEGNQLTVQDGAILGLELGANDTWKETYITVYTETRALKVGLVAAELIIDEAQDLAAFYIDEIVVWGNGNYVFANNFGGYYVLANDIDATGYVHDFDRGASWSPTGAGYNFYAKPENIEKMGDMGLTGTFDGNGHAIKNLQVTESGGLFGYINGGTVKNVAFINLKTVKASNSGVLCAYMAAGSVLQDTYWYSAETMNGGWNTQVIMLGAHEGAVLERNVFEWNYNSGGYYSGAASGAILTEYPANPTIKDFYYINSKPTNYSTGSTYTLTNNDDTTVDKGLRKVTADAKYVDGVERSATETKFYETWNMGASYDLANYKSIGTYSGSYEITLLEGIKRYTSLATLKADAENNDFSDWSADIWAVVDGYPQFASQVSVTEKSFGIGNQVLSDTAIEIPNEDTYAVSLLYDGKAVANIIPTVEIVSGEDVISVEGNKITANAIGEAVIKVTYGDLVVTAPVTVTKPIYEYETELQFSAHDGLFFNGDQVVSVEDIIGEGVAVTSVTAADGTAISYDAETGAITGFAYSTEEWVENSIIIETANFSKKVNVKIAKLIIDDATDFAYFTIKQAWDYGKTTANSYTFAENDFAWDGYYVLAKNIDATGYSHVLGSGLGNRTTVDAHTANRLDYLWVSGIRQAGTFKHGFLGTFDGQGYTISNLTTDGSGLLGVIATGVIKNLGMVNCNASNGMAPLAYGICGSSKIENVFVSTPAIHNVASYQVPLIAAWSSTTYQVKNFVTIDNRTMDKVFNFAITGGSLTSTAARDATNQAATFGTSNTSVRALNNVIVVSGMALSYTLTNNQLPAEGTVTMDAKYIDGVLNTATYTNKNAETCNPVEGVRRYTSQDTLTADAGNITAQLDQLVATGYFNVENGVITWKNAPAA